MANTPSSSKRLVIFPIPGNYTYETSGFTDQCFSFEVARVPYSLAKSSYRKTLLRNMRQVISCSLSKEFSFSCLLTGENSKSNKNTYFKEHVQTAGCFWKRNFLIYCIYLASLYKQQQRFV